MIKVYQNTKIYVYCPAGAVTGGAELIHQLVDVLRNEGLDAYIVYYGDDGAHALPSEYEVYNIAISETIEDAPQNIEIINEGVYNFTRNNAQIQKVLWWLSVDHFYMCSIGYLALRDIMGWSIKSAADTFLRRCYKLVFRGENCFANTISIKKLRKLNAMHAYQSEYAQNFLQNRGFGELVALKDYINTDHIVPFSIDGREDIVLYNPKKGMEFTKKLIAMAPELEWVPVQNMTRVQLVDLMRKSKLYLDFGYHPGKDRLPRECAMNGCCIITGKRGSARFFEDVAIADKYKFDEKSANKKQIIGTIRQTLENYEVAIGDFAYYRNRISIEKAEFEQQAKDLFSSK